MSGYLYLAIWRVAQTGDRQPLHWSHFLSNRLHCYNSYCLADISVSQRGLRKRICRCIRNWILLMTNFRCVVILLQDITSQRAPYLNKNIPCFVLLSSDFQLTTCWLSIKKFEGPGEELMLYMYSAVRYNSEQRFDDFPNCMVCVCSGGGGRRVI